MISEDNDEERVMHSKSGNIEIMISDKADELFNHIFPGIKSGLKHEWKVVI